MINILVCGICGKMGAAVANLLQNDAEARVCCGVDVTPCEDGKIPEIGRAHV